MRGQEIGIWTNYVDSVKLHLGPRWGFVLVITGSLGPRAEAEFSSVQSFNHVRLFATPWTAAHQAFLSVTKSWSLLWFMSIELVMPSNHLILCCPLLLLPPIPPSIRVFSNESALQNRWPNYWSFSFNISPSNENPGLMSFKMDWLDHLAIQGTLKSLLQHHSSKHQFFRAQLSLQSNNDIWVSIKCNMH